MRGSLCEHRCARQPASVRTANGGSTSSPQLLLDTTHLAGCDAQQEGRGAWGGIAVKQRGISVANFALRGKGRTCAVSGGGEAAENDAEYDGEDMRGALHGSDRAVHLSASAFAHAYELSSLKHAASRSI